MKPMHLIRHAIAISMTAVMTNHFTRQTREYIPHCRRFGAKTDAHGLEGCLNQAVRLLLASALRPNNDYVEAKEMKGSKIAGRSQEARWTKVGETPTENRSPLIRSGRNAGRPRFQHVLAWQQDLGRWAIELTVMAHSPPPSDETAGLLVNALLREIGAA